MAIGEGEAGRRLDERLRAAHERLERLAARVEREPNRPAAGGSRPVDDRREPPRLPPEPRAEAAEGLAQQDRPAPEQAAGHVLFLPSAGGYLLVEREGPPPLPGVTLVDEAGSFVVTKVGASPLPEDARPCAYTVPA